MVNPLIKRAIMYVVTTVTKSALKAYENTIKNHGRAHPQMQNPFKEFFEKTAQATKIYTKPMSRDEALKVLNLATKEKLTGEEIMDQYHKYYVQNDLSKGGSFYIQSKIYAAKEELMKDFPDVEKAWYEKHEKEFKEQEEKNKAEEEGKKEEKKEDKKNQVMKHQ